jgi:hypothetical protein
VRDKLITHLRLRELRASDRATQRAYDLLKAKAEAEKKGASELYKIGEEEHFERRVYLDEISQINSKILCSEARRLSVPISSAEEMWDESSVIGGRSLSEKGTNELRASIRKEKNERWAYWELRFKVISGILTALTGVAGALIGLATVLGWKFH